MITLYVHCQTKDYILDNVAARAGMRINKDNSDKKYCIINNCKKLSSYNYSGKKELLYCNDHKLDKMINVRKGYSFREKQNISYLKFCKNCEQMDCLLCNQTVNKEHNFSKKHIDNFDKNITIKTRTSIKKIHRYNN